jgi:hypothetical protein
MAPILDAAPHLPSVETGVQVPYLVWQPRRPAQKAGVLPQVPEEPQQPPNVLPRQVASGDDAAPHLPSVDTRATQVPKSAWQPSSVLQNAVVVPQVPEALQQSPKALYKHMAPMLDAAPHLPSVETGVQLPYLV